MAGLIDFEDFLDPSDYLVGRRIRWLIQVDNAVLLKHVNRPVRGRVAAWQRSEV